MENFDSTEKYNELADYPEKNNKKITTYEIDQITLNNKLITNSNITE